MSLINDALKRASQSDKNRPRDAAPPPVMLPAPERRTPSVPILLAIVVAVVILISLAMAAVLLWLVLPRSHNLASAPPQAASSESPTQMTNDKFSMTNSQSSLTPLVAAPPRDEIGGSTPAPLPIAASTNVAASPLPADPAPEPPPFPELKLQAIFYSRANPRAVINGQSVGENGVISEVRIVAIAQNKVTVEWNGQTRDLKLQGP